MIAIVDYDVGNLFSLRSSLAAVRGRGRRHRRRRPTAPGR